eukprot:NODE_11715_length_538_cov_125.638554_g11427_i0.p1 GENE.NODE_11715_length_538_cov_125.638554_g11427_i0~~NODE_11715_length_538_cov_125.638554_g11427_i0.p1  ORF type:complete len:129 (+),score=16.98 NODE_11715_length_538_cov_125.638554_g11427_i0:67-453(+)
MGLSTPLRASVCLRRTLTVHRRSMTTARPLLDFRKHDTEKKEPGGPEQYAGNPNIHMRASFMHLVQAKMHLDTLVNRAMMRLVHLIDSRLVPHVEYGFFMHFMSPLRSTFSLPVSLYHEYIVACQQLC